MKKNTIAALVIVLAGVFTVFSQQDSLQLKWYQALSDNDEYIHALESLDKNVLENAKTLIHSLQTKKALFLETANYQSDEIGKSLATSEDYLTKLQKATDIAMDEIHVAYFAGLHTHYRNAIKAREALRDELSKERPTKSVLEMNAQTIYVEVSQAELKQRVMQKKANITPPTMKEQKK